MNKNTISIVILVVGVVLLVLGLQEYGAGRCALLSAPWVC